MLTDLERLQGAQEHFDKYERLAQAIGVSKLKAVVPFTADEIKEALEVDLALNPLRLARWDACDDTVRGLVRSAGGSAKIGEPGGWSLGNTVCVLKHVARHHIAGQPRPVGRRFRVAYEIRRRGSIGIFWLDTDKEVIAENARAAVDYMRIKLNADGFETRSPIRAEAIET